MPILLIIPVISDNYPDIAVNKPICFFMIIFTYISAFFAFKASQSHYIASVIAGVGRVGPFEVVH
jgi:hypothetical protein